MNLFTNSVWVLIEKDNQWVPHEAHEAQSLQGMGCYHIHGQLTMFDTELEAKDYCEYLNKTKGK